VTTSIDEDDAICYGEWLGSTSSTCSRSFKWGLLWRTETGENHWFVTARGPQKAKNSSRTVFMRSTKAKTRGENTRSEVSELYGNAEAPSRRHPHIVVPVLLFCFSRHSSSVSIDRTWGVFYNFELTTNPNATSSLLH
jgi:hypothetical protein